MRIISGSGKACHLLLVLYRNFFPKPGAPSRPDACFYSPASTVLVCAFDIWSTLVEDSIQRIYPTQKCQIRDCQDGEHCHVGHAVEPEGILNFLVHLSVFRAPKCEQLLQSGLQVLRQWLVERSIRSGPVIHNPTCKASTSANANASASASQLSEWVEF